MEKCYMCDKEGTTREHVPPKCIFPESKDVSTEENLKKNLITVRSCKEHNTAKSKDDEYLLFFLAANILSNGVAQEQFATKVMRAVQRTPHVFADFAKKNSPVVLTSTNAETINTAAIEIDRPRFDSAIEHISHALHYHKYQQTFTGNIQVITDGLVDLSGQGSAQFNEHVQNFGKLVDELMESVSPEGDNPSVFSYKMLKTSDPNQVILQMTFYGGFKVVSVMKYV